MNYHSLHKFRVIAASAVILSGMALVAVLWFRPLTDIALVEAVLGATYLILGIGLLGKSRFSLFMGIIIPGAMAATLYITIDNPDPFHSTRMVVDSTVALTCAFLLWQLRHAPSK